MGWFLLNIIAPIVLPVIGVVAIRLLPMGIDRDGLHVMATVKDGQLCWAVIAMGAGALRCRTSNHGCRLTPPEA